MNDSLNLKFQLYPSGRLHFGHQLICRTMIASILSLCGGLLGASSVQAQFNSPLQISSFVQSMLEIELAREIALQNTQELLNAGDMPVFDCNLEAGTVSNTTGISKEIMNHLQSFCSQSQSVLEQQNLSPEEFRNMRMRYAQNPRQYPQITQSFQQLCQNNRYSQLQICR